MTTSFTMDNNDSNALLNPYRINATWLKQFFFNLKNFNYESIF